MMLMITMVIVIVMTLNKGKILEIWNIENNDGSGNNIYQRMYGPHLEHWSMTWDNKICSLQNINPTLLL